ncbi:J domain-containing protein [Pseudomonas syringae]|uniref:J domain-containing protein n=1 Tax=Pseudomonas syringae TaxID=317 RepID=UPI001F2D9F1D|nr:J domain-containing protein [Pseudomonas syringae]MCF5222984.1 DnaJ domain-containing protein [Pseudomonas syringae]MCF5242092.1 DnaJ domain-containing protein [Pseudomonas syringae]
MRNDENDPKGYYLVIGLTPAASGEQIKAAYRKRAMEFHPDRNPGHDTTAQFQFLNEAYAVLADPVSRLEYDNLRARNAAVVPITPEVPSPVVCSNCSKVSAQPRIVVFRSVKSFFLVTIRKPISGVYCSECAQIQSLKASAISWLLGWWGFPWGPIYTVQALFINMLGGSHPPYENARMLGYQAYYFYTIGRQDLARSIAQSALKYCRKVPDTQSRNGVVKTDKDSLIESLESLLGELVGDENNSRMRSRWGLIHKNFYIHLGAMVSVVASVAFVIINAPESRYALSHDPIPYSAQPVSSAPASSGSSIAAAKSSGAVSAQRDVVAFKKTYIRPKTAPNGRPWPKTASYLIGEPQTHATGHSEVTIDNERGNSDVLLKLVALQGSVARPARQIFVPAHRSFTIRNLTAGLYDVRYRDLTSGALSRSDLIRLTETTTYKGIEYSVLTLTLYKVANGNAMIHGLSEDEF